MDEDEETSGQTDDGGSRNIVNAQLKNVRANEVKVANEYTKNVFQYFHDRNPGGSAGLAEAPAIPAEELPGAGSILYNTKELKSLRETLGTGRVLVLIGERRTGRYFLARHLARGLTGKETGRVRVLSQPPPEARLNLIEFAEADNEELRRSVFIIRDALSGGNGTLGNLLRLGDRNQYVALRDRLRRAKSYLILTCDRQELEETRSEFLKQAGRSLAPFSTALLEKGLKQKLQEYHPGAARRISGLKDLILGDGAGKIRSISDIQRLMESLPRDFTLSDLETALYHFGNDADDVEFWFCSFLSRQKKSWAFAICLAMIERVSWRDFQPVHEEIAELLGGGQDAVTGEDSYLSLCRARGVRDPDSGISMVEFREEGYPLQLLRLMVRKFPREILKIRGHLMERFDELKHEWRWATAYLLGRSGELGGTEEVDALARKCLAGEYVYDLLSLAYLYLGILDSENETYAQVSLERLKQLAGAGKNEQWMAVATYTRIGLVNLAVAMDGLRAVLESNYAQLEEKLNNSMFVELNLGEVWKTELIIATIRNALLTLFGSVHPGSVLPELHRWLVDGRKETAAFVTLFLLEPQGLLEEPVAPQDHSSNWLIQVVQRGREEIDFFVAFLITLQEKTSLFQSHFRAILYDRILDILFDHWVPGSLEFGELEPGVLAFLTGLYQHSDQKFRKRFQSRIARWNRRAGDPTVQTFVRDFWDHCLAI